MDLDLSKIGEFDWDEGNLVHIEKHAVSDKECEEAFLSGSFYYQEDVVHSIGETRYEGLGETSRHRKIFLVFTVRNKKGRVISARDQNKRERREYEKRIKENSYS